MDLSLPGGYVHDVPSDPVEPTVIAHPVADHPCGQFWPQRKFWNTERPSLSAISLVTGFGPRSEGSHLCFYCTWPPSGGAPPPGGPPAFFRILAKPTGHPRPAAVLASKGEGLLSASARSTARQRGGKWRSRLPALEVVKTNLHTQV